MSVDGQRRRAYLPGLDERQRRQVSYYSIYPNLLLSLHPDYMMVHTLWPQTVASANGISIVHNLKGPSEQLRAMNNTALRQSENHRRAFALQELKDRSERVVNLIIR
jgi:hypothetical protein